MKKAILFIIIGLNIGCESMGEYQYIHNQEAWDNYMRFISPEPQKKPTTCESTPQFIYGKFNGYKTVCR
jgi:hypothetical protein